MLLHQFLRTVLWILLVIQVGETLAKCNECQKNGAACVNETSFQLCFGDSKPHTFQVFDCLDGLECTDLPNICFQRGAYSPSCQDLSECGVCNERNVFACTSRTTFALCFGATTASDVKGTCPIGYVCDLSSNEICVPNDLAALIVCDIDAV